MEKIENLRQFLQTEKSSSSRDREKEILAISEKYGDDRKTSIGYDVYDISTEDLIPERIQ